MKIEEIDERRYEELRKLNTPIIHVTKAVYPKINKSILSKLLENKKRGPVVFAMLKDEARIKQMNRVYQQLGGEWYFLFIEPKNRAEEEERIRKIIPVGLVKTEAIDAALTTLSKKG